MESETVSLKSVGVLQDFLVDLGARKTPHSGRFLYDHLCGVYSILEAWECPNDVCVAGMFHSIYSTEKFHHALLSLTERSRLQSAIGREAEHLVYLFAALERGRIQVAIDSWSPLLCASRAEIPSRWDASTMISVSRTEITDLALLHLANLIERSSKPATDLGFWLARAGELCDKLALLCDGLPKVLLNLGTMTRDDERRLHSLYLQGVSCLAADDPSGARSHLELACRDFGFVAEPFLLLAITYQWLGNPKPARNAAINGRALLNGWGIPWHKRLSIDDWRVLADLIEDAAPIEDIRPLLRKIAAPSARAQAAPAPSVEVESPGGGSDAHTLPPNASRFFSYLSGVRRDPSERASQWYPGLSRKPWYDAQQFSVALELESRFAEIKAEALRVEHTRYYEEAENIGRTGSWQVCMLYEQGRKNEFVCRQCPTITAILEGDPIVRKSAGLIYLSRMVAHTHIAAHQAGSNLRLRCHLAINIPHGDCAIRVEDEARHWEEGKCIVFDDTFEHEVWNRTDEERLVLLVDLWHPDLSAEERDSLDAINLLSVNKAQSMQRVWQRNDGQRGREGKHGGDQQASFFD
jgi:hypothetical protein